ncbi:MAG: ROK family transcriptional regulator [Spirochaetia bacterium]
MNQSEQLKIKRTANSNLQNEINISVIFNYLRNAGTSYRAQISKELNISAPAVSRAVDHLLRKGYLLEPGTIKTGQGKSAAEVMINPDIGYIIAVDLVKEPAKIAVTDFSGKIQQEHTGPSVLDTTDLRGDILREIAKISEVYRQSRDRETRLKAVSVGIPAATDFATGSIHTVLYENLEKIDIKRLLSDEFDVPVYIENISNLSAIGESSCGHGRNYDNLIFLEISNGIGAGIISRNTLIRGRSGYAGEIGYSLPGTESLDNFKQRKGPLERVASIDSMVFDFKNEVRLGADTLLTSPPAEIETVTGPKIFEAARKGDHLAGRIIDRAVKHVAVCVVNLVLTLDPEIIFVGGDLYHMPGVMPLFIEPLIRYVKNSVPFQPPFIQLSSLGENAGILGASYMAIETLLTGKYPYRIE